MPKNPELEIAIKERFGIELPKGVRLTSRRVARLAKEAGVLKGDLDSAIRVAGARRDWHDSAATLTPRLSRQRQS